MLRVNIRFIQHTMEDRRQLQALVEKGTPAVVLIHGDETRKPGDVSDVGRETSKVQTHQVLELSQEGCTFSASSPDGLMPGAQVRTRVVADGTALDISSRVVNVAREG